MSEKICPKCEQRRPHHELFCQTMLSDGSPCGWNLAYVPIDVPEIPALPHQDGHEVCPNGHALKPGDFLCEICGANLRNADDGRQPEGMGEGSQEPYEIPEFTRIGEWEIISRLEESGTTECFSVRGGGEDARGILTLYPQGVLPDPAVEAVVDALSPAVVGRILSRGEYNGRRFEVVESADGHTFADISVATDEREAFRRVVHALAELVHVLSRSDLRHRDLRPHAILPGAKPAILTICRFGFARLSSHDLDTVAPQELSRYCAPETLAGAVSPASDWWSLGIVLLEKLTGGGCFTGVSDQAFLMNVVAAGAEIPNDLDEEAQLLLRGLLARDRTARWTWEDVEAWARGEPRAAPDDGRHVADAEAGSITLAGTTYRAPSKYALAAGRVENWAEARDQLARGAIATWLEDFPTGERMQSAIRNLMRRDGIDDDTRLSIALKILNPNMPLVRAGEIVTPAWLLQHELEGYELISGPAPALLEQLGLEQWLVRLQRRETDVRRRAADYDIELSEDRLRLNLLCTSRQRLGELWSQQRGGVPDSDHRGLASLMDRPQLSEEDLVILLSAGQGQFRPTQEVLREASELAATEGLIVDEAVSTLLLQQARREIMQTVAERVENFARCGLQRIDEWVDQFRLERRTSLARAVVILSVPSERWQRPPGQEYVSQLLGFFEKRINVSVSRGALARMTITKTSPRLDLMELGTARETAERLLAHVLERSEIAVPLDPAVFSLNPEVENRLRTLVRRAELLRRETGIDGLYMGFPFIVAQPRGEAVKPRIAPVLLWPIRIGAEVGQRGLFSLGFDRDREEVRVNPALQNLFSRNELAKWETARDDILAGASSARAVMDEMGHLTSRVRQPSLGRLPGPDVKIETGSTDLVAAAVLFHVTFVGQAIVEDIRQLRSIPPTGTNLEPLLRVQEAVSSKEQRSVPGDDIDRYTTAESDPTQDRAVVMARSGLGLVIEGPPGTGKSQTIVNMVADGIGRKKSILIICQKQAALEVVSKRLHREGLADRFVMVTDVSKDRRPVIQAVREQIELIRANGAPDASWQRQRKAIVARIGRLEDKLNEHQQTLHARDEISGLTYRELISELISLEDAQVIGDCPEIREALSEVTAEKAEELIETCASLAHLWLPAEYEGSALENLKAFGWDDGTVSRFRSDLEAFWYAERKRPVIARRASGMIEFEDAEPAQRWIDGARDRFSGLDDRERKELAYFINLFIPSHAGVATGPEIMTKVSGLHEELLSLVNRPKQPNFDAIISEYNDAELETWISIAESATRSVSLLESLSLSRYLKRRKLRRELRQHHQPVNEQVMRGYLARAGFEAHLRAIRTAIRTVYEELGVTSVDLGRASIADLVAHADWLGATLKRVAEAATVIGSSPAVAITLAAVKTGAVEEFDRHFAEVEAAIARSGARSESRRALSLLERWCEPSWIKACKALITKNHSTDRIVTPVVDALGSLAAYQHYRIRAVTLSADAAALLAGLRRLAVYLRQVDPYLLNDVVRNVLRREACLGWKAHLEHLHPILLLEQQEIEGFVRSLAEAEIELRQVNKKAITANIDTRRLGTRDKWEDITRFTGPRRRTLREFIDLGWDMGLKELRPVWLMGPDVASRMLPLRPIFDLVVYDEASQMPVEFALPSLFRGKAVVVSGDDQQLPPTSFFANRVDSDEDEAAEADDVEDLDDEERRAATENWNRREIKDCPNLLELSKAVLPKVMLQVHYRSSYRELISFSNNAFYNGELNVPVRHPVEEVGRARPLEVLRVKGVYEQRTNLDEADKVVGLLASIWIENNPPSVGVVTFNRDQADLIEQRLEERAEVDPAFKAAYRRELGRIENGEDMRFFVKNVENVQGDERDRIIFSTTFGRNRQGTFKKNFGVLGQSGGERRLNVAVTRAREKVAVVTSMPIDQIAKALGSGRKPQVPRDYLQLYLAYAAALSDGHYDTSRALLSQVLKTGAPCPDQAVVDADGFAHSVASYIVSLGMTPEPANDGSAFGIDFAIRHPQRGTFGIGIECGVHRHAILARARAREIWRRTQMRKSIPVIHRVSLRAWYHERGAEQSRLRDAILQATA